MEDEDRGGGREGGEVPAVVPEVEDEEYGEGREGGPVMVPPAVGQGQQGQQVACGAHHDDDHNVGDNESGEVLGGLWEAEVRRERAGC